MPQNSLFGEIAIRLSTHPENIATESLRYIFEQHSTAWPSVRRFLERGNISLPESLVFRTQSSGEDSAIPDLVGIDSDGVEIFLLEAKFWAGLTSNQPVTYMRRIRQHRQGVLCFVAPDLRLETLWPKLLKACEMANIPVGEQNQISAGFRVAQIPDHGQLALLTWRSLLSAIEHEASTRPDYGLKADVDQLAGLCNRMDGEAFLPLQSNDLSPEIGRRVQQYAELVDSIVSELAAKHKADTKGLSTGGSKADYGRYFLLNGLGCFLGYRPSLWGKYWETPIWLSVSEKDWTNTPRIYDLLSRYSTSRGIGVFRVEDKTTLPIELPLGAEKDEMLSAVISQINEITNFSTPNSTI